ncbi:MAG: proline--tRNA ligase, partial [Chloroflexi bacterium]|nr:proline--tRNA ligase [Chloroflexota bacterium]
PWCGSAQCEDTIKELKASNRCIPLDPAMKDTKAPCVVCGKPGVTRAIFARAY